MHTECVVVGMAPFLRKEKAIVSWKRRSDSRLKVAGFNTASPVTGR
jgi:hypothetical protein